jgi:hypothetical protein
VDHSRKEWIDKAYIGLFIDATLRADFRTIIRGLTQSAGPQSLFDEPESIMQPKPQMLETTASA